MGTEFDSQLYERLDRAFRMLALRGQGDTPEAVRVGTQMRILNVLGTARVNAQLAVIAAGQGDAAQRTQDALADVELALTLFQSAVAEGVL